MTALFLSVRGRQFWVERADQACLCWGDNQWVRFEGRIVALSPGTKDSPEICFARLENYDLYSVTEHPIFPDEFNVLCIRKGPPKSVGPYDEEFWAPMSQGEIAGQPQSDDPVAKELADIIDGINASVKIPKRTMGTRLRISPEILEGAPGRTVTFKSTGRGKVTVKKQPVPQRPAIGQKRAYFDE